MKAKRLGRPPKVDAKDAVLRVRVDQRLDAQLRAAAKREGVTVAKFVRRAIRAKLPPA